jgi:hypothetical protein
MFVDAQNGLFGHSDQPLKMKETMKSMSPTGALITTTKTVYSKGNFKLNKFNYLLIVNFTKDGAPNGIDGLADSALRDLARTGANAQANKSTLIIHSVQRVRFDCKACPFVELIN